jgi:hypothetical protein
MPYRLLLLCLLGLALTARPADAHRLYVRYQVLPGNKVQVTSYCVPGDWAADGIVAVFKQDGQLLGQRGVLDDKGRYVFQYAQAEDLKVVVTYDGHSKEVHIAAKELSDVGSGNAQEQSPDRAEADRFPVWEIVAGLSLLLAVSAFCLSVRTAQRLREIQQLYKMTISPVPNTAITAAPPAAEKPRPTVFPTAQAPG